MSQRSDARAINFTDVQMGEQTKNISSSDKEFMGAPSLLNAVCGTRNEEESKRKEYEVLSTEQNTLSNLEEEKKDQIKESDDKERATLAQEQENEKKQKGGSGNFFAVIVGVLAQNYKNKKGVRLWKCFAGAALGYCLGAAINYLLGKLYKVQGNLICAAVFAALAVASYIAEEVLVPKFLGKDEDVRELPGGGSDKQQIVEAGDGALNFLDHWESAGVVPLKHFESSSKSSKNNATNDHNCSSAEVQINNR